MAPVGAVALLATAMGSVVGSVVAAVDGAFLGGIAAIITAIGTFVLGLLTLYYSQKKKAAAVDAGEAEAWRRVAEALLAEKERGENA